MVDISSRRWNQLINAVNHGTPKDQVKPPIQNGEESEIFDDMVKELAEMRRDNPKAAFWPVETEW